MKDCFSVMKACVFFPLCGLVSVFDEKTLVLIQSILGLIVKKLLLMVAELCLPLS